MWYSNATRGGDSRSLERMKSLSRLMVGKQLTEAEIRAYAWTPRAAKTRNLDGQ
jgi:hypothetical protein